MWDLKVYTGEQTRNGRTAEDLIEEMLEFGLRLELAERLAAVLLPLENDPRGFRQALLEDHPRVSELCGVARRH